jgi:hypothetical protein
MSTPHPAALGSIRESNGKTRDYVVYGHGGDIPGFETHDAITADGTAVTISVTALPTQRQGESQPMPVDDVLCADN